MVFTLISDELTQDEIIDVASELYVMGLLSDEPKPCPAGDNIEIMVSPENTDEVLDILYDNEIYTIE